MNCEYHTNNCKVILTTGSHKLILCNESSATPATNTPLPIGETTTHTERNIPVTSTEPTTVSPTTYSPTVQSTTLVNTHTPTPYLRGYKTTTSSSYKTTTSESKLKSPQDRESSEESVVRYIYVETNSTKEPYTNEIGSVPPDLTALWVCMGILAAAVITLVCKHYLCKKKNELKRRRSITPDNPPPVNRHMKNRNSWSQNAKAQDVLLHMNQMHDKRGIPREHRKSMEALRSQIQSKRRKPPALPPHTIDLSKVETPPSADARKRLAAITIRNLDNQSKAPDKKVMTITELASPGGMDKLKAIRQEKRGVQKLRSQVRKLQSINKTVTSDK
jgi:hypothetical protein